MIYTRGLFNYLWNIHGVIKQNKKFDTTVREDVDGFVMEISKALDAAARWRERSITIVNVWVKLQMWRNLQERQKNNICLDNVKGSKKQQLQLTTYKRWLDLDVKWIKRKGVEQGFVLTCVHLSKPLSRRRSLLPWSGTCSGAGGCGSCWWRA